MPYKGPEKRKEYLRNYHQKLRDNRKKLLSTFPCKFCGESDPDLIDWHHVNPDAKKFNVTASGNSDTRWWNEVLKCIPLCCNCHRKIHKDKLCLLPIHL